MELKEGMQVEYDHNGKTISGKLVIINFGGSKISWVAESPSRVFQVETDRLRIKATE